MEQNSNPLRLAAMDLLCRKQIVIALQEKLYCD